MNALRLFTRPQQKSRRSERSVEAIRYKASWICIVIMTCATKARRLRGMAAMDVGIFQRRLLPRERILWSGVPAQGLLLTGRDMILIPFSLVWCGFAIFWTYSATRQGAPLLFKAWGGMFICIGLFLVLGRFAVDAWLRRRISYAVTDKRILIMRSAPFSNFTSIDLERLPDIQLTGEGAKRGNLRFGAAASYFGNQRMGGWSPALDPVPQFLGIEEPSKVFDLITKASNALRSDRRSSSDS